MIEGIKIKRGEAEYIIPPLSLGQVKKLYPIIEKMQNGTDTLEKFNAVVVVAQAALSRNYPEITAEAIEEIIDLGNIKSIIDAVMGISGFVSGGAPPGSVPTGT